MPLIITPSQLNQRAELYHQLGMMITAGLTVHKALEHLASHPPSRDLRAPCLQLLDSLNQGLTVTESIRRIGKWIPSFDLALIEAGEQSGRLDACFKLLAEYYRERAQMVRQMISDLMYPLFLFNFSLVLFPFVKLVSDGNFVRFIFSILVVAVPLYGGVFLVILACQGRHGEAWRSRLEKLLAPVPILGSARRNLALARLSTALESLINAGVPIVTAWELAATSSGSPRLSRLVQTWRVEVDNGASFSELVTGSGQFPDLFCNLYHTGEVSGTTDQTLRRLHTLYQTEALAQFRALSRWTPKIVYFGIMILIAIKVIMFYMGYFAELNRVMDFK